MYLSRLIPDTTSHAFRRDHGDLQNMHRTVMSGFPHSSGKTLARTHHGVLWRMDATRSGYTLYVQSHTRPTWDHLTDYLAHQADVRDLSPVLEAIQPGRKLAFRLTANPTKRLKLDDQRDPERQGGRRDNRYPVLQSDAQIAWLVNQGGRHGFTIPAGTDARPDVAPTPSPRRTGRQTGQRTNKLTVDPVSYDGHLIVTDTDALLDAVKNGIGPAKAYGCGLLTLARATAVS